MAVGSKLVGIAAGIAARKATMKLLDVTWRKTRHTEPPVDPAAPSTSWADAMAWAVASGVALGVARMVATKGTATAKLKLTGKAPDGMEPR